MWCFWWLPDAGYYPGLFVYIVYHRFKSSSDISHLISPAPYPALPSLHRSWTQACSRPKSIGKLCIVNPGRCFPFNIIEFWGKSFKLKRDRKDPKKTTLGLKKLHWNNILKAFGWASTVGIRQFIKILHTNSLNQLEINWRIYNHCD